jgi:hypothetical protein
MGLPLLATERRWVCPNCTVEDWTYEPRPHTRFHICKGLRGLTAPLVPAGIKAKVELREREDYVGAEKVQLDPELGRPVMSVVTTRDNGQDTTVFAPAATGVARDG